MTGRRILFLMSGSIAAYKACHVISRLVQKGHEVEVVASPWALEFVGAATLEGLTGRPVHQEMFGTGAYMSHIHLDRWADLVIVCPATANTINKLANGIGDDLLTTVFLAHDFSKPWLIAPAMNSKMYHHPITRESVRKLTQMGCKILETASGVLACGEIGDGKLLDPELLLLAIETELESSKAKSAVAEALTSPSQLDKSPSRTATPAPRILITSGGTEEPIDRVRSITNISTGETGKVLADVFSGLGYQVTLLKSQSALGPRRSRPGLEVKEFRTFQDLKSSLEESLRNQPYDAVIHAAAVSDYHVESQAKEGKIESSADEIMLKLKRNPKLLDELKNWSKNKKVKIVGFKFTAADSSPESQMDRTARIDRIARSGAVDYLVTNDLFTYPKWQLHQIQNGTRSPLDDGDDRHQLALSLETALFRK